MSTYAVYRIWCGVLQSQVENSVELGRIYALEGMIGVGIAFEDQRMNGERVGFGTTIRELDWVVEEGISKKCIYDPSEDVEAIHILAKVKKIFAENGISTEPKLYHLLDLGG